MIQPKDFVHTLKKKGHQFFTGVPCSFFQSAINCVIDDRKLSYTIVPNEGSALALAAGRYLAGSTAVLMIQNSGFGNLVNPLTSLNMIYRIPALIFISGRAYGVEDEPQHEVIGRTMGAVLDALGVHHRDMPADRSAFERSLEDAHSYMERERQPFVFFVRKDTIGSHERPAGKSRFPMKRIDAIRAVSRCLKGKEYVIATTGKPSRELFAVFDRQKNFYMQGSMGHAASIGLGVALSKPKKKVIVLDGDGALLMHMGVLSSIGHYQPKNLYHIVLDNESYESTGDQDTTSATTDFRKIAKACGYRRAYEVQNEKKLEDKLRWMLRWKGPSLLRVKINREATADIPRISGKYSSPQIADSFREDLSR